MAAGINVRVKLPAAVGFMQILAPQNVTRTQLNGKMILSPLTYNLARNKKMGK